MLKQITRKQSSCTTCYLIWSDVQEILLSVNTWLLSILTKLPTVVFHSSFKACCTIQAPVFIMPVLILITFENAFLLPEDLMHSFQQYILRFPRGTEREQEHAHDHVIRVRNMRSVLDSDITVESLKATNCVQRIASHWRHHTTFTPGTKRSYLNSLGHFIDFVEDTILGGLSRHQISHLRKERQDCQKSLCHMARRRSAILREGAEEGRRMFLICPF